MDAAGTRSPADRQPRRANVRISRPPAPGRPPQPSRRRRAGVASQARASPSRRPGDSSAVRDRPVASVRPGATGCGMRDGWLTGSPSGVRPRQAQQAAIGAAEVSGGDDPHMDLLSTGPSTRPHACAGAEGSETRATAGERQRLVSASVGGGGGRAATGAGERLFDRQFEHDRRSAPCRPQARALTSGQWQRQPAGAAWYASDESAKRSGNSVRPPAPIDPRATSWAAPRA
jgi:hypothetical protein